MTRKFENMHKNDDSQLTLFYISTSKHQKLSPEHGENLCKNDEKRYTLFYVKHQKFSSGLVHRLDGAFLEHTVYCIKDC